SSASQASPWPVGSAEGSLRSSSSCKRYCGEVLEARLAPFTNTAGSSPQRAVKGPHVLCKRVGLLHCGEMAALPHACPAANVGEHRLGQRARRMQDLAREFGVTRWHGDGGAFGDHPGPMHTEVIRIERRSDRAGEPIEADVPEYLIAGEDALDIAPAIGP